MPHQSHEIFARLADALEADWSTVARPNQLPPPGDWRVWLLLAGRGFGKTRTITEFVRAEVEAGRATRIAVVGATAADCRDVLAEGPAGLLAIAPRWNRPTYEPTKRRVTWPSGAVATLYSADEPARLRGPQHDLAICDELAAWRYPEALDMLLLGLRLGRNPRVAIATTPRSTRVIRELLAREGRDVVVTRGSTLENRENLAPAYIEQILERYKGTRLERQEIFGEVLEDAEGALWSHEVLEATRVTEAPSNMQRIVIAVDPAGSAEEGADETGIIVAGLSQDRRAFVLDDLSGRFAPPDWAKRAISAYHAWRADRVVCETNYGGAMVAATIAAIDPSVPVKEITSSRGKVLRAEPIAALFEQRRAHIVGHFAELEDQACNFTADWSRSRDGSPDRVDALVFAMTELTAGVAAGGFFSDGALLVNTQPVEVPQRIDVVFATAATGTKSADTVGIIYFAQTSVAGVTYPLTILDWDALPVDAALFDRELPRVFERLDEFAAECHARGGSVGLWARSSSGVCAAVLQQCAARQLPFTDIDAEVTWPPALADRAHAAARHIHSGRKVKISRFAYEKISNSHGVTRNHLLAQFTAFRADEPSSERDELLDALASGVLLALDDAPEPPEPATAPITASPGADDAHAARQAQYAADLAAWTVRRDEALARLRLKHGPAWRPTTAAALGIGPQPQAPGLRLL